MRRLHFPAVLCLLLQAALAPAAGQLSYADLVARLTDLERLAVLPDAGERCAQWSSFDRQSRYDPDTDTYRQWEANGDGNGIIRREGELQVLAEMDGPGCIWRIWSARAGKGHVRIYLDGAERPAVDMPFADYFNGQRAPFNRPGLVHTVAQGLNCYVPIPYQKSCKIVAEPGWGQYYHFTYSTFPPGTTVPTFRMDMAEADAAALDRADEIIRNCGQDPAAPRPGQRTIARDLSVPAGGAATVAQFDGSGAITTIRARLDLPSSIAEARLLLRELAVRITWDGAAAPQVWAPFNDFFGTAAGANKYRSLPLGLTDDGWYCHWYMPFAAGARLEIVNDGQVARNVHLEVTHAPLSRPIETLGRLHCKYHRDAPGPGSAQRRIDWTMLHTQGRGRYVGVMLHVWNPRGGWWGEGDEKFFVDGEKFPSTFGTGSEDYFGYAWCSPVLFQHAFHNQTISMGNAGHVSVNRWHIADNVPFQSSFVGDIEKYYPNDRPTRYAATAWWYLAPGGTDPYPQLGLEDRIHYWQEVVVPRVEGALEAEEMKILKVSGRTEIQPMGQFNGKWSNQSQLWWPGATQGARLDLALPVPTAGTYFLVLQFTKARDYGIVQVHLDGQKLGEGIDLYNTSVVPSGPINLGPVGLTAGEHTLTLEVVGRNPQSSFTMVGLDYVMLRPLRR